MIFIIGICHNLLVISLSFVHNVIIPPFEMLKVHERTFHMHDIHSGSTIFLDPCELTEVGLS